jgi:hypothetical protein
MTDQLGMRPLILLQFGKQGAKDWSVWENDYAHKRWVGVWLWAWRPPGRSKEEQSTLFPFFTAAFRSSASG